MIYAVSKVIETVLQSTQAYRMSQFVSRLPVNRFFVFTIVINCWSTPVINYYFKQNAPLERILSRMFDIALDFTSTVGVPVVLALPFWKQSDFKATMFPDILYYNDFWFVNMINQLRVVFVSSWMNLFSDVIFLGSLLLCLQDAKKLLRSDRKDQRRFKKPHGSRNSIKPVEAPLLMPILICKKSTQKSCN